MQKKPSVGSWGIVTRDVKTSKECMHGTRTDNSGMGYCEWCKCYKEQKICDNCGRNVCKACATKCPECKKYYCPLCSSPSDEEIGMCYECQQLRK